MSVMIADLTADQQDALRAHHATWLEHGTCTDPADRPTAESAISRMYTLIGQPAPQFVWVDSPATASLAIWLLSGTAEGSLRGSLRDSLRGSLRGSLWDSLEDSLRGSLWGSLRGSLRGSLEDSLRGSLWGSLRGSLWGSLEDSLRGSLWGSLEDSLRGSLWDSLRGSLRDSLYTPTAFWGAQDAYWVAFYASARDVLGVAYPPDRSMQLDLWADIARSAGWWWPFEGAVVISERPSTVRMERIVESHPWGTTTSRLHCMAGPALAFRDGWTVHAWHGTSVPADLIEGDGWSTDRIMQEENAEIRRCAIERMGWDHFIRAAGLQQVGGGVPDPGNPGHDLTLWDVPERIYGDTDIRVLLCTNGSVERDGTRRRFGLTVPAEIDNPVAAAAWGYDAQDHPVRVTEHDYARLARRR